MEILRLGLFFDIPVLLLLLAITVSSRCRILALIAKYRLPRLVAFFATSIILLIVEENINCGQFNCQTSLWPPTLNFLLPLTCVLGAVGLFLKPKRINGFVVVACIIGLLFELTFGGSASAFRHLEPGWFILISVLTLVSYGVIFLLPFHILLSK